MRDHVRDESLKTPLNKGILLKNVRDEGCIPNTMYEGEMSCITKFLYKMKFPVSPSEFGLRKVGVSSK